ncbi:Helicase associated domain protein [Streptomyces sp. XH2]|uniref:helicase associated domain-containing protein n=1 Tax=Streptomyces sp. XH2 TaxID=3412483 RepID=UPI003C7A486E
MAAPTTAHVPRVRLFPHQSRAVHAAHTALRHTARTSVVMACGTGKTYVAARIAARVAPQSTRLVLLPTLELLAQTIDDWRIAGMTSPVLALCSKRPNTAEPVPYTTDPAVLTATAHQHPDLTVFATYHSLGRVVTAHHDYALPPWSCIAVDEAHRTSGHLGKRWAAVHDDALVPAHKRLYLTATPRIWSAGEPGEDDDPTLVASMDDPALYGETCYRLPLAEAIDMDLLADYRIVVTEVHHTTIRTRLGISDRATEAELRQAALQIAVLRAMAKLDLRRAVSFHHRRADAHAFAATLPKTAARLYALDDTGTTCPDPGELWATAIDGTMDPAVRRHLLDRFDGRPGDGSEPAHRTLIANARLLGEGVNIPAIDTVIFADPKESIVDTVQAVGRALRQKPGQGKKATLIVPVYVAPGEDADDLLNSNLYKPLWRVLQALRAHDDRIADRLAVPQQPALTIPGDEEIETVPVDVAFDRPFPADTIAQAFRLRVLHPREASFRRGLEAATAYYETYGHLDVPQLHDDEHGFALGRWINRMRKAHAAGTLEPRQIKALEQIHMIWNLRTQAAERGLLHARQWAERHGHLAVPTDETIGDYAFGRWLTNRRRTARERAAQGLAPDATDTALAELDPWWNPPWPISWQRLYYTARTYAEAGITLDDLPSDFLTDDDEPLGEWVRTQSLTFHTLHPEQAQLIAELGITPTEPAPDEPPQPAGRAARQQRQLDKGLAGVEAFRAREGHVHIRQRDTVLLDGEVYKVGQWLNNLRKRWDTLPAEHLQAVTAAGLTRHAQPGGDAGQ